MQLLSIAALALPALVAAQGGYGGPPPAPVSSSSSSSSAAPLPTNIHLVTLGTQDGVTFNPNTVSAKVGDTVVFQISSQATVQHGIVQSDPNSPCSQLSGGLDSGLMSSGSSYAITVNTTQPLSFFCPQTKPLVHCEMGMVMIINPSSPSAISSLQAAASKVTSEATATMPQSSGSGIAQTAVPTQISGSSSSSGSGSGSGNTNSAIKGSVATVTTLLTAVMGLFVTMA